MDGDEGGGSNDGGTIYVYDGSRDVPRDVTRVRVNQSVTVIRERAFSGCRKLEEVELPEGLLGIGDYAFYGCNFLSQIAIPSTVTEIGEFSFDCCVNLVEVVLPEGLQKIGHCAFARCASLPWITIPSTVNEINGFAFCDCKSLTEVILPDGLERLGRLAFEGCTSLPRINIPSIECIGVDTFRNCTKLIEVKLSEGIHSIERRAFMFCTSLKPISMPSSLTVIGHGAFCRCDSFSNFRIPPAMTKVDMSMFSSSYNCTVSLELHESIEEIEYAKETRLAMNFLRNFAIPPGCSFDFEILDRCNDLKAVFPDESGTEISDALKQRFGGLSIHELCYYQPYHSTETVMGNLRREINPWSSKFSGTLNATGKQQDCLGMTPLHILACSTKHDLAMVQLLVAKYPETLVMKDKWGSIPLMYAFWCNASEEIVLFLVESHRNLFPCYELDWNGMIKTLVKARVPASNIEILINARRESFPDQSCDLQAIVVELIESDSNLIKFNNQPIIPHDSLQLLLQSSILERLELLDVRRWKNELEKNIKRIPERKVGLKDGDVARLRKSHARALYAKLATYELLKEAMSLLELALWKSKIDESASAKRQNGPQKKAKVGDAVSHKEQCRISCGADIVLRNVFPYLCPN